MGRRIRWLGVVLLVCFGLVIVQLVNVQYAKAPALSASADNPRNAGRAAENLRGDIDAADRTLLAKSVKSDSGTFDYTREYPGGSLYSQIVGFDSTYEGTAGVEYEYNAELQSHQQRAQNLSQSLGLEPRPVNTDSVTLTVEPRLQEAARAALSQIGGPDTDAAVVAIAPSTGAILADYSTPSFDPAPLEAPNTRAGTLEQELAALSYFKTPDHEGNFAGVPLATNATFPPGSTFKVVTTAAVYNLKPSLAGFDFPLMGSITFPGSSLPLTNEGDDNKGGIPCGGTLSVMLAQSCDPGYGKLGVALGATDLAQQAALLGYNAKPPIDLPAAWVATSSFPSAATLSPTDDEALLAYSAIGQYDDKTTALSNALVAAGIANGGAIMTPHVMEEVRDSQGKVVVKNEPAVWRRAMSPEAAAQTTDLMKLVATAPGATALGVFPPGLDVAVKTGTAQTGDARNDTDDWMIGFAPASNPTIAVAVVVPLQVTSSSGATIAGPIMRDMFEAALLPQG
jgi:peptidoglycan glycosyltransferase